MQPIEKRAKKTLACKILLYCCCSLYCIATVVVDICEDMENM